MKRNCKVNDRSDVFVWQNIATIAGIFSLLCVPAFAGNGCNDTITANCAPSGGITFNACINFGAGGFQLANSQCRQYRRTTDNAQFLTLHAAGAPFQTCIQQNDTC